MTVRGYCNLIGGARFLAASTSLGIGVNPDLLPQVAEVGLRDYMGNQTANYMKNHTGSYEESQTC